MTNDDRPNANEGADPSEDVRKQNPGETTTADLTDPDRADDDQGEASRQGSRHADDDDGKARGAATEAGSGAKS